MANPSAFLKAALCGLALLLGCSRSGTQLDKAPRIENPIAQVLSSGAGAAYLRIVNDGADDVLDSVEAPGAADAQLHELVSEGELSVMRAVPDGFSIPARSSLQLEHGGKHIMLFGVKAPNTIQDLRLTLHFRHAGAIAINVPVRHGLEQSQAKR